MHAGRAERLAPGEGQIDLPGLLAAPPRGIPLALAVPMTARTAAEGPAAVAAHVLRAARSLLAGLP